MPKYLHITCNTPSLQVLVDWRQHSNITLCSIHQFSGTSLLGWIPTDGTDNEHAKLSCPSPRQCKATLSCCALPRTTLWTLICMYVVNQQNTTLCVLALVTTCVCLLSTYLEKISGRPLLLTDIKVPLVHHDVQCNSVVLNVVLTNPQAQTDKHRYRADRFSYLHHWMNTECLEV